MGKGPKGKKGGGGKQASKYQGGSKAINKQRKVSLMQWLHPAVAASAELRAKLTALHQAKSYKPIANLIRNMRPSDAVMEDTDVLSNSMNVIHVLEMLDEPKPPRAGKPQGGGRSNQSDEGRGEGGDVVEAEPTGSGGMAAAAAALGITLPPGFGYGE
jgi:hypothetical protein